MAGALGKLQNQPKIEVLFVPLYKAVGGFEQFLFFRILRIIIPTDLHIVPERWFNHQPVVYGDENHDSEYLDLLKI